MKIRTPILSLASAMALAVSFQAVNALALPATQTNVVQTISVSLNFLTQGPSKINNTAHTITSTGTSTAVNTKTLIGWLGLATTNNFTPPAELVRVKHFTATTNTTTFEVRYGTKFTNSFDVTAFFSGSTSSEKVDESTLNTVTQVRSGNVLENIHVVFTNQPASSYNLLPSFHVSGFATDSYLAVKVGTVTHIADQVNATACDGAGTDANGNPALVTGSITITGNTTEIK